MKIAFRINYSQNGISKEELYPILSYIDMQGNVSGQLFDTLVFDLSDIGNTTEEWENAIDSVFFENRDFHALNIVFGDIKLMLGLDNKCKVYIQAPIPPVSLLPFGDINRDGIKEKLLDNDDCVRAYEWFVLAVKRRFSVHNLQNLDFKGFIIDDSTNDDFKKGFQSINDRNAIESIIRRPDDIPLDVSDYPIVDEIRHMEFRVYTTNEKDYLSKCAVSGSESDRIVYRMFYEYLSGLPKMEEAPAKIIEELPEENAAPETEYDNITPMAKAEKRRRRTKKSDPKQNKKLLFSAGVAATVLGIAYIIKKASKD